MKTNEVKDVFETLLVDAYDAALQLKEELPKFSENTKNPELSALYQKHLRETEVQIDRLENIFDLTEADKKDHKCLVMQGLLEEAHTMMSGAEEGPVRDLGMVAYGKKIGHFQIATYDVLSSVAQGLGYQEAAQQLKLCLSDVTSAEGDICGLGKSDIGPDAIRMAA